jgi:hypothetical protein
VIAVPRVDRAAVGLDRACHRSLLDATAAGRADAVKGNGNTSAARFIARFQA